MSKTRKWGPWVAGAVAVGVISLTTAAAYPVITQAADSDARGVGAALDDWEQSAALAGALGISEEELDTAITTARQAAIDAAVDTGRLSQEQADALTERDLGRFGGRGFGGESDTLLAAALGITVEELTAAREQVVADRLAQAVADGDMTQAQVDRMLAQQAFQEYQRDQAQTDREAAIQAAVEAGAITQAQADLLLSDLEQGFFGRGLFGRGGFGPGSMERGFGEGFGGPRGRGGFGRQDRLQERGAPDPQRSLPGQTPDDSDSSEESTPENESSFVVPDVSF